MVSVVVHTNLALRNQRATASWLKQGFHALGITCDVTPDKHKAGDIHIVQGPWYAYSEWLGEDNVLWLDRAFYGDAFYNVSLGWLRSDGSRDFRNQGMSFGKGALPELKPKKEGWSRAIVFGDYHGDPSELIHMARSECNACYFRPHPQDKRETLLMAPGWDMKTTLDFCDVAFGHSTTALVDAEIAGLHVRSTDDRHVVQNIKDEDREQWLIDLSWSQWSSDELKRGEFWEHLC